MNGKSVFVFVKVHIQYYTFTRQHHKMIKHSQETRRQKPTNCLSVFDHFVGLPLKGLKHFLSVS